MNMVNYFKSLITMAGLGVLVAPLILIAGGELGVVIGQAYLVLLCLIGVVGLVLVWLLGKRSLKFNLVTLGLLGLLVLFLITALGAGTFLEPVKSFSVVKRGAGAEALSLIILALGLSFAWSKLNWNRFLAALFSLTVVISLASLLELAGLVDWPGLGFSALTVNQAGIFAGLGLVLGLTRLRIGGNYFSQLPQFWERLLIRAGVLINFFLVITIGTRFITVPVLGSLLVLSAIKLAKEKKVPKLSLALLVLVLILAWNGPSWRLRWVSIPAEPSLTSSATWQVIKEAGQEKGPSGYLFGAGWGSFKFLYQKYKPAELSASQWWNQNFEQGPSEFLTLLAEKGLLGIVGFLALIISLLIAAKTKIVSFADKNWNLFFGLVNVTLYWLVVFFWYPFGLSMWALLLVSSAGVGFFSKGIRAPSWGLTGKILVSFLILALMAYLSLYPVRRATAQYLLDRAEQQSSVKEKMNYYQQANKMLPNHPRPLMKQAQQLFQQVIKQEKQWRKNKNQKLKKRLNRELGLALKIGQKAVQSEPRDIQLPFMMADMYLKTAPIVSDPELATQQALIYIKKAKKLAPASPRPSYRAAQAWFTIAKIRQANNGEVNEALAKVEENLNQALEKSPGFPLARKTRVGVAYFKQDYSKTVELGRSFLKDYPQQNAIRQKVAQSYYQLGQIKQARKQAEAILKYNRAYLPALILAGKIAAQNHDFNKAIDYFERARAKAPKNEKLPQILGELRKNKNPFAKEGETATTTHACGTTSSICPSNVIR